MEELNCLASGPLRGAAFSKTEVLAEAIVLFLGPPCRELVGRQHIGVSIILAKRVFPTLVIPCDTVLPNFLAKPSHFQ